MTTAYDALIQQAANTYALPFDLLQAQCQHESSMNPWAFRYEPAFFTRYILNSDKAQAGLYGPLAACSYGLMQVLLESAYEIGFRGRPEELFMPATNLDVGAHKMRTLWDRVGGTDDSYRLALARYNGVGSVADMYADVVYRMAGRA